MDSYKVKYVKVQSSTDRTQGSLSAFTVDLSSVSYLQSVRAAQIVSVGFTHLTPNVRSDESTVIVQTNEISLVNTDDDMIINLFVDHSGGGTSLSINGPPAGNYNPQEWATALTDALSLGTDDYTEHVTCIVDNYYPLTFLWSTGPINVGTGYQGVRFEDAYNPLLGFTPTERIIFAQEVGVSDPTASYPIGNSVTVDHEFKVPAGNYNITELLAALNSVSPLDPTNLDPTWSMVGETVHVTHNPGHAYPRMRVISVIENRRSSLAPLLGFHGYDTDFVITDIADTPPGLFGLLNAYLHIRPIATAETVTVSSRDKQALQVSVAANIPTAGVEYGEFTQHDFSASGDTYLLKFKDDRDISRFQCRLRDHQGHLLELAHPGVTLFMKLWIR
jgi:hypothetical protein